MSTSCIESSPISTLEELINWSASERPAPVECLPHKCRSAAKVLVCHDMLGGYLDDRFLDGCHNPAAYRFFHWSLVDIFVYFSHHFVTIPPTTWINAAHTNGVLILGTLIVEGPTDSNEVICGIFKTDCPEETLKKIAIKLVELAKFYCFDGWFINIECKLQEGYTQYLVDFLKLLTDLMHQANPRGLVIWYDSVIHPTGKLEWQNELNQLNKSFFDACDGIFLNYNWDSKKLKSSYDLAIKDKRNWEIFVGIDVFGRGCFGGGGMNTCLAVEEIKRHDLSMAIFAPGWTHEVFSREDLDKFLENEYSFWRSLNIQVNHWPCQLPVISWFCQGFGHKQFACGKVCRDTPWHNLTKQQLQPADHRGLELCLDDAFNGGASLVMKCLTVSPFVFEIPLIDKCIFVLLYKNNVNLESRNLKYEFHYNINGSDQFLLVSKDLNNSCEELKVICYSDLSTEEWEKTKNKLEQHSIYLNNLNNWRFDCFLIEPISDRVTFNSIKIIRDPESEVRLGLFALI